MNNKWVSVKERLPDFDEYVLWTDEMGFMFVLELDKDGNEWLDGQEIDGFNSSKVTHWQPLPLPPTEEPNSISNESIDEDELVEKFKESQFDGCIMCDDSWDDKETCANKCVKVAIQYHQSKTEELEKWIDENTFKITGIKGDDYDLIDFGDLKAKIKSL